MTHCPEGAAQVLETQVEYGGEPSTWEQQVTIGVEKQAGDSQFTCHIAASDVAAAMEGLMAVIEGCARLMHLSLEEMMAVILVVAPAFRHRPREEGEG